MKKALLFAGLAAAALSFVGCNKEADIQGPRATTYEVILNTEDTRTVNQGMSTKWEANDALTAFYASSGTTEWSENIKFTVQDAETGRATGEVTLEAGTYDWYMFYPYTKQLPNPTTVNPETSKPSGYTTIGGQFQAQAKEDDMAHLAGPKVPLFGRVMNVSSTAVPGIAMKHAAAVIRFNVQNKLSENIYVKSIKFTAPTDFVGTYYVNFTEEEASYVASGESYVFDNATLTVSEAQGTAPNGTSAFYLVAKPFTAANGSDLTVEIVAENADGSKSATLMKQVTLTSATEFVSACIKTLNIPFDKPMSAVVAQTLPYEETFADGAGEFTVENVTGTGIWNPATASGQKCMKGTSYISGSNTEAESWLISPEIDGTAAANGIKLSFKQCINKFFGNVAEEATLWAREKGGDWKQFTITYPTPNGTWSAFEEQVVDLSEYMGKTFQFAFKYVGHSATAGTWEVANVAVTDEAVAAYTFLAELEGSDEVAANITSVTIKVTGNVPWTAEPSEGVTLDKTSGEGNATITASFAANTATTPKNYSVMVRTTNTEVDNDEWEITFTQAAASATAEAYPYEETFATSQGDFTIDNVTLPEGLSYVWSFDTRKFMKASGYKNPTNYATESWLISPVVDLATAVNPALTFKHATNFFTSVETAQEEATVWAREENGTWAKLEGVNYPTSLGWTFVDSGSIDLSAYAGKKIQIGFKYTSTATKAGTWEIQNFKLDEAVTGPVDPEVTVPSTISVEKGSTATIDVTTNSDGAQTWSTSDATVATVANGVVTGVKAGTATITLSIAATTAFNAATKTIAVTVTEISENDVVFIFSEMGLENAVAYTDPFTQDGVDVTFIGGGNTGKYYNTGSGVRIYGNGGVVVSTSRGISKISYTFQEETSTAGTGANQVTFVTYPIATDWTVDGGTFTNGVISEWTGSATSVTLTRATGGGHWRLQKVVVTCEGEIPTLSSITLANYKTELMKGSDFNFGGTVTAHYSNSTTKDVTSKAEFTGYDMNTPGTYTVTVSYTEEGTTKTATYTLTVSEPVGGITDILNQTFTGITGSSYTDFSGKKGTSGAIYAGQCAGSNSSIQLRAKNDNCGIITTTSGGKVRKVTVTWESHTMEGRTLNIYGKNAAYSSATDLYDEAKQGTLLGSVTYGTSTELTISGDYQYIGLRSAADAMYLSEIDITWE